MNQIKIQKSNRSKTINTERQFYYLLKLFSGGLVRLFHFPPLAVLWQLIGGQVLTLHLANFLLGSKYFICWERLKVFGGIYY